MKRSIVGLAALMVLVVAVESQGAIAVSVTLTADNHYGLYYGKEDGSSLAYVGRNETTDGPTGGGAPGQYNWTLPETWNFATPDYIYVMAWDDGGPQGWLAEFTLPSSTLLTNLTDWEFYVSASSSPGTADPPVGTAALSTEISSASWAAPLASAANGSSPWGTIPGISSSARWIWHDTLSSNSSSDGKYVVFRTVNPVNMSAVPEPASLAIWSIIGLTFTGIGWWRRRKSA